MYHSKTNTDFVFVVLELCLDLPKLKIKELQFLYLRFPQVCETSLLCKYLKLD